MESQVLIDLGALVALIVGLIAIFKAIRKSIDIALAPHVVALDTAVKEVRTKVAELDKHVLTVERHDIICGATRSKIEALEKALCAKIQILIDIVGIRKELRNDKPVDGKTK